MVLYINACVRKESRTDELAKEVLGCIGESYIERKLSDEPIFTLSEKRLEHRTEQITKGDYSDAIFDYAKEFASADTIVISAPFWDLSFPTLLKMYIENIYVTGIVSKYGADGKPQGLCRADKLFYVTTAGGPYDSQYSYDYIRELCISYFGIKNVQLVKAEMMDIVGNDVTQIMMNAKQKIHLDITAKTKEQDSTC